MIVAFTRLHYGQDFLDAVIRATEGYADKHVVIYTPFPSFGRQPSMPCPDSRADLYEIAKIAGKERLHWIEHPAPEGRLAFEAYPDADLFMECDADEIYAQQLAADIVRRFRAGELTERVYRLPFVHHWRSFHWACTDAQWPMRLYLPKNPPGKDAAWYPAEDRVHVISHFGYARKTQDMLYKLECSLHNSEFRPGWWEEKYCKFPTVLDDLHPVSIGLWNAEPYADGDLPAVLIGHALRSLEVIE